MPDSVRAELHAATLEVLEPLILGAGLQPFDEVFRRPQSLRSSYAFEGPQDVPAGGFRQAVRVSTVDAHDVEGAHRLLIDVWLDMPALFDLIFAERTRLTPQWASRIDPTMALTLPQVAKARGVALPDDVLRGLPYVGQEGLQARLPAVAALLRDHLLPILRGLDSVEAVAAAWYAVPLSLAPGFTGYDDLAIPLAFERAALPQFEEALAEIERHVLPAAREGYVAEGAMLQLIEDLRAHRHGL